MRQNCTVTLHRLICPRVNLRRVEYHPPSGDGGAAIIGIGRGGLTGGLEAGSGIEPLYTDLQSIRGRFSQHPETSQMGMISMGYGAGPRPSDACKFLCFPGVITQDLHTPQPAKASPVRAGLPPWSRNQCDTAAVSGWAQKAPSCQNRESRHRMRQERVPRKASCVMSSEFPSASR
jgi:hypothetical protein